MLLDKGCKRRGTSKVKTWGRYLRLPGGPLEHTRPPAAATGPAMSPAAAAPTTAHGTIIEHASHDLDGRGDHVNAGDVHELHTDADGTHHDDAADDRDEELRGAAPADEEVPGEAPKSTVTVDTKTATNACERDESARNPQIIQRRTTGPDQLVQRRPAGREGQKGDQSYEQSGTRRMMHDSVIPGGRDELEDQRRASSLPANSARTTVVRRRLRTKTSVHHLPALGGPSTMGLDGSSTAPQSTGGVGDRHEPCQTIPGLPWTSRIAHISRYKPTVCNVCNDATRTRCKNCDRGLCYDCACKRKRCTVSA